MEERLKKIEELLADYEKRLQILESMKSETRPEPIAVIMEKPTVRFDETGRPFFNVILPQGSRQGIQKIATLLLMHAKRTTEPEMTSNKISSLLHKAGVDTRGIKYAFNALRTETPALITSKPGKRTIILTSCGEEKAVALAKELQRK
ncbi:MAG: hypothetical protein PHY95_00205 [Candidatus ainarchaeum sp.]|nr:hypothetical protein [Candidatus ainarchaeum sp.]